MYVLPLIRQCRAKDEVVEFNNVQEPVKFINGSADRVIFQSYYEGTTTKELKVLIESYKKNKTKIIYDIDDSRFDVQGLINTGVESRKAQSIAEQVEYLASNSDLIVTTTAHLERKLSQRFSTPVIIQKNIVVPDMWGHNLSNSLNGHGPKNFITKTVHKENDRYCFGYFGTPSHQYELANFVELLGNNIDNLGLHFQCRGFPKHKESFR